MLNPVPVAFLFSIWGRRSEAVASTHQTQKGKVQSCSRKHTCSPTCDNPGIPGSTMLRPGHLSFLTGADVVCTRLQEDFELCITLLDGIGMLPLMFAIGIWQGISLMASLELGTSLGFDGVLYVMLFSNAGNLYKMPFFNRFEIEKGSERHVATIAYEDAPVHFSLSGNSIVLPPQLNLYGETNKDNLSETHPSMVCF